MGGKEVTTAEVHNYPLDKEDQEDEQEDEDEDEDEEDDQEVTAEQQDDPDYEEYIQEQVNKGNIRMRKVKIVQAGNISSSG